MKATIDAEVKKLESILADSQVLRIQWSVILNECKIVANSSGDILSLLLTVRKKM